MDIRNVAVIGCGTMGNGIAQAFATSGHDVALIDVNDERLRQALATIEKNLGRMVKKETLTENEARAALTRIRPATEPAKAAGADFLVEAATENRDLKKKLFATYDALCRPEVILATNTSSIPITEIAAATRRPDRVIGMHFFNPVPVMKLVEVIRALDTSDATCATVKTLATRLGKTPVEVKDSPGFVSNRLLMPLINEAIHALHEGVADAEAIDTVMKLGMAHPMGPLRLADFIGLDVCLAITEVLWQGLGQTKYLPCPLLRKMVAAGHLGEKSGRGFFTYPEKPK
ncbi:MAG: 3-hydroxybutyryl-CoA dehydrogenase [Planctomycetes bacterium]|nr:3-hydroxybutyryl-CoA dehydrogenase [Planctomycetota bacterium]